MTDYRHPAHRALLFTKLYELNLRYGIMPGLVYLYIPALIKRYSWSAEERLWFAFLNGLTQNPITSFRMFGQLRNAPKPDDDISRFTDWFSREWDTLQFDTDRRYQKKETVKAIQTYSKLVHEHGSQERMLTGRPFGELWSLVRDKYYSFGRLSSFSYLEYVKIAGHGADCSDLYFHDRDGSKSHRNGMLMLLGRDELVDDKRARNGFNGEYERFNDLCDDLSRQAYAMVEAFRSSNPSVPHVSNFTFESNLCTFKNHFFGRRYPGVYADMALERIKWADDCGQQRYTQVFKEMRSSLLPAWLRDECAKGKVPSLREKASVFPATGFPYRGLHFLK